MGVNFNKCICPTSCIGFVQNWHDVSSVQPHVMALGAFLLVGWTLFAAFGIPCYVTAKPFESNATTGAVYSAICIAAAGVSR